MDIAPAPVKFMTLQFKAFPPLPGAARTLPSLAGDRIQQSKPKPNCPCAPWMLCNLYSFPGSVPPNPASFTLQGAERLAQTKAMHPSLDKADLGQGDTPKTPDHTFPKPPAPGPCLCLFSAVSTSSTGNGGVTAAWVGWEQRAKSPEKVTGGEVPGAGGGSSRYLQAVSHGCHLPRWAALPWAFHRSLLAGSARRGHRDL